MLKIGSAVFLIGLLSSCSPAEASPANPAEVTPPLLATHTATPDTMPASFLQWESTLSSIGYDTVRGTDGVNLHDSEGNLVIYAPNSNTLSITASSGEVISFSQDSFEILETLGAGVPYMLTMVSTEGIVEYFYLERNNEWVTPIKLQTDPQKIEDYTVISLEDVWNGRVLYSEALVAAPFSEETIVPDGFFYNLRRGAGAIKYWVELHDVVKGNIDMSVDVFRETIRKQNDYRRLVAFYRSETPDGVEIIIAAEQILLDDGATSLFLHYAYAPDWSWEETFNYAGNKMNLITSMFLAKLTPVIPDGYWSFSARPIIFWQYSSEEAATTDWSVFGGRNNLGAKSVRDLYLLDYNNPVLIKEDLAQIILNAEPELDIYRNYYGFVSWAETESLVNLQYMALYPEMSVPVPEVYFESPE